MSEDTTNTELPSKLDRLKQRADQLGISYSKAIKEDALSKKINDALEGKTAEGLDKPAEVSINTGDRTSSRVQTMAMKRQRAHKEANRLVRVVVTCMNPDKSAHEGEIFTFSNSQIGTIKKYVVYDAPYHVPQVILDMLENKKYRRTITKKNEKGRPVIRSKIVPEYGIKVLPPLGEKELKQIAARQAAQLDQEEED